MRHFTSINPTNSRASISLFQWNTPLPYIFIFLMLVFGIIAVSLLILACCHKKSSAEDHSCEEKEEKSQEIVENPASKLPEVVVILAGDDRPRFVAKPVAVAVAVAASACNCKV
ncbi:hypothetical protein ACFE04_005077 [Oxalis oulophora]